MQRNTETAISDLTETCTPVSCLQLIPGSLKQDSSAGSAYE